MGLIPQMPTPKGRSQRTKNHLAEMAVLPNPPNADFKKGFTDAQVAEKHGWHDPLIWG